MESYYFCHRGSLIISLHCWRGLTVTLWDLQNLNCLPSQARGNGSHVKAGLSPAWQRRGGHEPRLSRGFDEFALCSKCHGNRGVNPKQARLGVDS